MGSERERWVYYINKQNKTSKWPEAKLVWIYNTNTHTNKNNTKKKRKIKKEKEKKKEEKPITLHFNRYGITLQKRQNKKKLKPLDQYRPNQNQHPGST